MGRVIAFVAIWLGGSGLIVGGWLEPLLPGGWSMASPFLKLAMGAHRQGRSLLYINPGTNYWGIPFRIGTPPEITVLTLRASADDAQVSEQ